MKRVLIEKAYSSKQFRDKLIHAGNRLLVESSPNDLYWGSGLNYHLTQTTHPDYYPGLHKLGKDHHETTCQVVQTTGDSDSVDNR